MLFFSLQILVNFFQMVRSRPHADQESVSPVIAHISIDYLVIIFDVDCFPHELACQPLINTARYVRPPFIAVSSKWFQRYDDNVEEVVFDVTSENSCLNQVFIR